MPSASPSPTLLDSGATRVLLFGGILLLVINMLLGEVFAIFVSHVASSEIRERWLDVVAATQTGTPEAIASHFQRIEFLLERRGRIMNAHSHVGAFGMLAVVLALLQPLLSYGNRTRYVLALCVVSGGLAQPLFVLVSAYTGPWANFVSDLGALLVVAGTLGTLLGCAHRHRDERTIRQTVATLLACASSRLLLRWGMLLILLGMLFGFAYAWVFTTSHEPRQYQLLASMLATGASRTTADNAELVRNYRGLNSRIAILAAVHSHAIEMGTIALLLAFIQCFVQYRPGIRRFWARAYLAGAYLLPFFIFNATIFGLPAAAFADLSGFLVLTALLATLTGVIRRTGLDDAAGES